MLEFIRTKTIGVQAQGLDLWVIHGRLDDALYTVDLRLKISRPDLIVQDARGRLLRYTTNRCPLAEEYAGRVKGQALGRELSRRIKDDVGKAGCRHLANLFADCAQAAARAELKAFLAGSDPAAGGVEGILASFYLKFPQLEGFLHEH
ncbi:MAG: DUF2889 domain-containing protein [Thermodesulfobacteriota bacterium]